MPRGRERPSHRGPVVCVCSPRGAVLFGLGRKVSLETGLGHIWAKPNTITVAVFVPRRGEEDVRRPMPSGDGIAVTQPSWP